jgi:hypothetical protein
MVVDFSGKSRRADGGPAERSRTMVAKKAPEKATSKPNSA